MIYVVGKGGQGRALQILCLVAGLSPPWPPLSEATTTASRKRPRPAATRIPTSPWPSHPLRNPAGHDRTQRGPRWIGILSQKKCWWWRVYRAGGSLWSVRGAGRAVEPCPAWSAVHRRLSRNGQLSTHTPTDHRRGSLCPQVDCVKTNKRGKQQ